MGTTPFLVKPLTQVNTTDTGPQAGAVAAGLPDGGYWAAWLDNSFTYNPNGAVVVGQRYDSAGNRIGGEIPFLPAGSSGRASAPAIATSANGHFAVAYTFEAAGSSSAVVQHSAALEITQTNSSDPALTTFADGSFIFAFTRGSGADTDIVFVRVDPVNRQIGSPQIAHDQADNAGNVELATLSNGNFVAVFQDQFNGSTTDIDIRYRVFTAAGAPVTPAAGSAGVLLAASRPSRAAASSWSGPTTLPPRPTSARRS
jgi:hypothetical protein